MDGNLFLSILLQPQIQPRALPLVTLGAGVVLAEIVGRAFSIKWPNDVVSADGKKLAGILAEAEWHGGRPSRVVVGFGVNIVAAPTIGTSLLEHGVQITREELAEQLLDAMLTLDLHDQASLLNRWRDRSGTLGRAVTIGSIEGIAVDLDTDGALLVDTSDGLVRVITGDLGFCDAPIL